MEKLGLYDINRVNTNTSIERGYKIPDGLYRVVVHVVIINSKGEMLIQKRTETKKYFSGLWDITCGGCLISGETSQEAASRELKEELGIDIDLNDRRPNMSYSFDDGYDDIYIIKKDVDINSIVLQKEEVSDARYETKENIFKMINDKIFVNYYKTYIDFLFEMVDKINLYKD